ncbi:MAG: hypothetical protein KIT27_08835 [Legionellales bacterium]|nr:hypothetical protein [Legionellales bacterium]
MKGLWYVGFMCLILPLQGFAWSPAAKGKTVENEKVAKPACAKPDKPMNLNRAQMEGYRKQIEEYRQCIVEYVKKHNELSQKYNKLAEANRDAANAALTEWNEFVAEELENKK